MHPDDTFSDEKVIQAIKTLYFDPAASKAIARGHDYALHDNLG